MSKKYSSYSKHGEIFENWRRFLNEEKLASPLYDGHLVRISEELEASNEDMLLEFRLGLDFKDILQFIAAAAVEYGLDATIAGAPASLAADTVVDALFAGESFITGLSDFTNLQDQFDQGKEMMEQVFASREVLQKGFDAYYDHIQDILSNTNSLVATGSAFLTKQAIKQAIRQAIDMLKKQIDKLSKKIADIITKAVKIVVPDATVGLAIGAVIKTALLNLADNAYSALTNAIELSPALTDFITDPELAKRTFEEMYDGLVSLLTQVKTKIEEDAQWSLRRGLYGLVAGPIGAATAASPLGQEALVRSLSSALQSLRNNREMFLNIIASIFDLVIPALFGLLATWQIFSKNDIEEIEDEEPSKRMLVTVGKR
jgi:hypothetical protein